jgi:urease accessory protein
MRQLCRLAATAAALAPAAAWAHPGHVGAGGFVAGLTHPMTGIDHLAAMLLVGLWTGFLFRSLRAMLLVPSAFLTGMVAGFVTGSIFGVGFAEPLILLSLLTFGSAAVFRLRAPPALAATAAGLFGFAHGQAHGFETPSGAFPTLFAMGFLLTTGALQALGLWLARILPAPVTRALGATGVSLGLLLAATG